MSGEESTGVQFVSWSAQLREDGPYTEVGSIHLHHKVMSWVGMLKDGGVCEQSFLFLKSGISGGGPGEGWLLEAAYG